MNDSSISALLLTAIVGVVGLLTRQILSRQSESEPLAPSTGTDAPHAGGV